MLISEQIENILDNHALEMATIKGERMFMVVDHNNVVQATSLTNEVACVYANSRCQLGDVWSVIPHDTGITI